MKEGTSALVAQSGLSEKCWSYLRNIQEELEDTKLRCERRLGSSCVEVYVDPAFTKDERLNASLTHFQLVRKFSTLHGVFARVFKA